MTWLKKILTPPRFDDEMKTQQAFLLHIIVWTLIFVPIPFLIYNLLFLPENLPRALAQTIFGETVNVILLLLLRRGLVRAASIIQVSTFWVFFTVTAATDGGVQGEAYLLGYSLVIVIAGILLGGIGAAIFTVLSLVSGAMMTYVSTTGWFASTVSDPPISTWMVSLVLFPVSALLQHLSSRTVRDALARARASEERYRLISQIASDYTFSTEMDAQGNMQLSWVAGAFEDITGFTYDEYVASGGWRAHLHPEDREIDDRDMAELRSNRKVITEVRHYKKNGEVRWARVYAQPVWDTAQNKLAGIVGAVQDITAQKQAEDALRKSEAIYRQAIEVAGAVPYHQTYHDNLVHYDFIGDGISQITGYSASEFDEQLLDSLVVKRILLDDLGQYPWDEAIERVRQGDYPMWRCEHCIRGRDGKLRWVFEAAVELRDEKGISHGSIGMFQDITEQKITEERKAYRQIMLEKVIRLGKDIAGVADLWTTLEKVWHGVHDDLEFDRLAIFLYNPERKSMDSTFGTDTDGHMLKTWGIWFPVGDGEIFTTVLEKPGGFYFTHNYDIENKIPPDHEMYGVKDFTAIAAWSGDKPVAVICADHRITGRPITAEQLEALRLYCGYVGLAIENARLNESLQSELNHKKLFIQELESKNAELERFTYTVSHDLKSPLVTITGFLGYLVKDAQAGNFERVQASSERIRSAAQKMERLLSDLLELSRVGRLLNPPVNVRFEEIVEEALEHVQGRLAKNHVQVAVLDDLPIVHVDKARLVEAVQNLLDNAAKFSADSLEPRIEVGTAGMDEHGMHILFVCDNGMGIDPGFHERIFGLFNKLNPHIDGTGIGLTLVKRIIEIHGGRIWLESQPGQGAKFYFTLPAQTPPAD